MGATGVRGRRRGAAGGCRGHGVGRHPPHRRRQARTVRLLRHGHGDAAATPGPPRRHEVHGRQPGGGGRSPTNGVPRPGGGERSEPRGAQSRRRRLRRAGRQRRRLPDVLDRPRREACEDRRQVPHVHHRRPSERTPTAQCAGRARAQPARLSGIHPQERRHGVVAGPQRAPVRALRRSRGAPAAGPLPHRLRHHRRPAHAADALQQPQAHRANAGQRDDPHRDGSRRPHRAHERRARAGGNAPLARRLYRPLGRRHAGGGNQELQRHAFPARRFPGSQGGGALQPH